MAKKMTAIEQNLTVLTRVKDVIARVAQAAAQDIAALEASKTDKLSGAAIAIPVTAWESDGVAGYPKYYDIVIPGVTAVDRASIDLSPASQNIAAACGLCPVCETLEGKIRLRAANVPTAVMTAHCWIEKGV